MTLELLDTTAGYDDTPVLEDVSLSIQEGELVALLGPNGSGKSTLLKTVDGMLSPSAGTVRLNGTDVDAYSRQELARHVGYLPQAQSSTPAATVFDTVLLGRQPYFDWRPGEADRVAVEQALETLGIGDLAMREVPTLSGGQRRLVLLARALVQATDAILLDEPTSGLDLKHQHAVMRRVRDAVKRSELAGVLAIHDLDLAVRFCDRYAFLADGQLHAVGGEAVLTESVIESVYDVPVEVFERDGRTHVVPLDGVPGEATEETSQEAPPKTAIADGNGSGVSNR
jgi:iron complex transport system ATP-binding protein